MRRLRVPSDVALLIRGLHPVIKRKIRTALAEILDDPEAGKPLKEDLHGLWSFRVGRIRVVYRPASRDIVEVVAVGPRATIYEETLRLVKKDGV